MKTFKIILISALAVLGIFFLTAKFRNKRPNIIIITIDALRRDHLGCYGYGRLTSPNIDELAKKGVLFDQAITQAPVTAGSVPSLFSSTYPSTNGHCLLSEEPILLSLPTLSSILQEHGYFTAAISAHGELFSETPGLEDSFDTISDTFKEPADILTNRVIKWFKWFGMNKRKPFFLWIHYFDTHAPYQPPNPYDRMFVTSNPSLKEINLRQDFKTSGLFPGKTRNLDRKTADYYICQYDGGIRFIDDQINLIVNFLKNRGLFKNTIIVITADHGENLYDRKKQFGHGFMLYDVLLRVPLIFVYQDHLPAGTVINRQVQLIDITPTLLKLAGIKTGLPFEGRDLSSLMSGKRETGESYAFSEIEQGKIIMRAVRLPDWKLIEVEYPGSINEYELYNLKKDPNELTNLVVQEKWEFDRKIKYRFDSLRAKLEKWRWRDKGAYKLIYEVHPLDEDSKTNLKVLGYFE